MSDSNSRPLTLRIAGYGLATPLGTSAPQTWSAMLAGGAISDHAAVPIERSGTTRVTQLATHVLNEAINAAGWSKREVSDDATALLVGTSKGPIEDWLRVQGKPGDTTAGRVTAPIAEPQSNHPAYGLSTVATELAQEFRLGNAPRLTLSAACASGLHALIRACMLIQSGAAQRALVVAVESSLHPLFLGSFQRLGVIPKPSVGCRPFDQQRDGFLMSEAAAAICLEATSQPETPSGLQIDRFAMGGAAGHITAGDATGGVWRHLLKRVIGADPLDLVHAHATGTHLNDPIELAAIEASVAWLEQPSRPSLFSHKGALGHSLGAAGLVSIVLNCMMHERSVVLPNVRTTDPLAMGGITLSHAAVPRSVRRSIAAASGFGGPTAVVSVASF